MKIGEIKIIVDLIITSKWEGRKRLDNIIIDILACKKVLPIDKDYILDTVADPGTKDFQKLVDTLFKTLKDNDNFRKIEIFDLIDGIYIEKKHSNSSIDDLYEVVINKINLINKEKNKGIAFEQFCMKFLVDLGINCSKTSVSNDKGIDILGYFPVNFKEEITNLVFNQDIYLLIQTKFFAVPVDTPVIRKLVGDSLFIRFDELEYLHIRHNAFHLIVFSYSGFTQPAKEFAEKNKIILFDKIQIAHIISESPEKVWSCLLSV